MGISIIKIAIIILIIFLLVWALVRTCNKTVDKFESLPKVKNLNGVQVF